MSSIWQGQVLGTSLSDIVTGDDAQDQAILAHQRGTTEPTTKPIGSLWNKTDYPTLGDVIVRYHADSQWKLLMDARYAQVNVAGTVPFTANQAMGGNKLTGLAEATANGDAVRFEQALLLSSGDWNAASKVIKGLATPTANDHAATKAYVDAASGVIGGNTIVTNGTLPTRTCSVSGLAFTPKVVIAQLIKRSVADAETSGMIMASYYSFPTESKSFIDVSRPKTLGSGILDTYKSLMEIQIDTGGFTFTYQTAIRSDTTYPTLGYLQWAAFR